ncbi:MAG: ergothioneine biosynthesis protein EgtB [Planctomycetota bacterium]
MTRSDTDQAATSRMSPCADAAVVGRRYLAVRGLTERLASHLSPEDACVQAMPDASPAKWHLGHTTWFFEQFVLGLSEPEVDGGAFRPHDERFCFLFNSYYNAIGERQPRPLRGLLTRPSLAEVMSFRRAVDERMLRVLGKLDAGALADILPTIEIGLQHEQQHQELLLTDAKYLLWCSPLRPALIARSLAPAASAGRGWVSIEAGLVDIGHDQPAFPEGSFAYDCEGPVHRVWLEPYEMRRGPVTNAEFAEFIADGGYTRANLWLDLGWKAVQAEGWASPLYWTGGESSGFGEFTLHGEIGLDPERPVVGLSFFEADAFARWAGKREPGVRLPTEQEWEHAVAGQLVEGRLLRVENRGLSELHPAGHAGRDGLLAGVYGDVWEWTSSQFRPYPGYAAAPGAIGEYNGKFMCNQFVLRGGSCVTPADHVRVTYRNFFPPDARWQTAGLRLARDRVA